MSEARFALAKYHALGNDYLIAVESELPAPLTPERVRRLCDRNRGAGSDGILAADLSGSVPRLRVWNPDGSEAEKSGNGLRIFARFLHDRGLVRERPFRVDLAAGSVECRVHAGGGTVTVEMGRVSFESTRIPVTGPAREVLNEPLEIAGETLRICAATIGNPHCVVFRERVSEADARSLGPLLERHPLFPNRTNVQLAEVIDDATLRLEIWERGAGYTLASGSSSCAAAAHRLGRCGPHVRVLMPGGELAIEVSPRFDVRMTGPVVRVGRFEIDQEALRE